MSTDKSMDLITSIQNQVMSMPDGGVDDDTRAVAGNVFGKRLSIKGGVFRKFMGGKQQAAIEDRHMNVIFVKMNHSPSRNWYEKTYVEGENIAPSCWSTDSKTPDLSVPSPPAKSCSDCPKSIAGSAPDGKSTACRLSWRTAVVLPSDPGGDVMQLVLPATSVFGKEENGKWPFRAYVQMLANNNISASRVITKMVFDTDSPQPKLLFSPVGAVPGDDVAVVKSQGSSHEAAECLKMAVFIKKASQEGPAPARALPPVDAIIEQIKQQTVPWKEDDAIPEPVLRESKKAEPAPEADLSEVLKKWSSKKG
jgi:hypothetical protein